MTFLLGLNNWIIDPNPYPSVPTMREGMHQVKKLPNGKKKSITDISFHLKRFFSAYISELKKVYFMSRSFAKLAYTRTVTFQLRLKNKD